MFMQLKAQAPEVSDDQVIAQDIKALCPEPLHNHLVKEQPKTIVELYENFTKFSKSEVLHFRKFEKQRKALKHGEASRLAHYNDARQHNYHKHANNINFDGCRPLENWEKNFGSTPQEMS
jgi:hypothetical protein